MRFGYVERGRRREEREYRETESKSRLDERGGDVKPKPDGKPEPGPEGPILCPAPVLLSRLTCSH